MVQESSISFDRLLHQARLGDIDCLGRILETYRNYLRLLARMQTGQLLQVRVSPSDLVQESILVARNAFDGFRGNTEPELLAWLRSVLAHRLVDARRFHSSGPRDYRQEQRFASAIEDSSCDIRAFLAVDADSPSQIASKREQEVILADALARLPSDYGEVIVLRHLEHKSFSDIAATYGANGTKCEEHLDASHDSTTQRTGCRNLMDSPKQHASNNKDVSFDSTEQRLTQAMEDYLAQLERGEPFDRVKFIHRYADLEPNLSAAIESMEFLNEIGRKSEKHKVAASEGSTKKVPDDAEELGDFHLIREIGRGGMGVVYEAEQRSLRRRVALKVLPFAALLDQRRLTRFQNEARAAAMLKHPNIVSVYSVGCERGIHYYAMELIEGQNLCEAGRFVWPDTATSATDPNTQTAPIAALSTADENRTSRFHSIAHLGIQAAGALHYAHQQGVIHRDIKPSNLLLDRDGQVHVADFGLARIQTDDDLTMTGDLIGTLRYMSPEHLDGHVVDERTDVYALGITLYELATGQTAFQAENRQELSKLILDSYPIRPTKIVRDFPRDLETVIFKAISKEKDNRYRSAAELCEDLQRFVNNRPVRAKKPTALEVVRRWIGRNRVVSALLASIVVLSLSLAGMSAATALRLTREAQQKEIRIYSQDMRLAHEAVRQGDFISAEKTLINWVPDSGQVDHRGFEWSYLWQSSHDPAIERTILHRLPVYDVGFVGSDSKLAVAWWSGKTPIWNLNLPSEQEPVSEHPTYVVAKLLYLPQQTRLIYGSLDGAVQEWNVETGELVYKAKLAEPRRGVNRIWSLAPSQNEQLIAVGAGKKGQGCVSVWNRLTGEWILNRSDFKNPCFVQFGTDDLLYVAIRAGASRVPDLSRQEALTEESTRLIAFDVKTKQSVGEYDLGVGGIHCMEISADRKQLIIVANPIRSSVAHVIVWNVEGKQVIAKQPIEQAFMPALAVSADSTKIAVGDVNGNIFLLDATNLELIRRKRAHSGMIYALEFSPDGSRLASACSDNYARIWNVEKLIGQPNDRVELRPPLSRVDGADFIDDNTVVSTDSDGRLFFWDALTGTASKMIPLPYNDASIHQLAVSHDRKTIVVTHGHGDGPERSPGQIHVIDAENKEWMWSREVPEGIDYTISSFSNDDRWFAICRKGDTILIYDRDQRELSRSLQLKDEYTKSTTFSPDGRWFACGTRSGHIHVFSLPGFRAHRVITSGAPVCVDVDFSPDSKTLATTDFDKRVKFFDPDTGDRIPRDFKTSPSFDDVRAFLTRRTPDRHWRHGW